MKLSVIISNRNDLTMLSVTVRSCIEAFRPISKPCEIVIADNSDQSAYAKLSSIIPAGYIKDGTVKILRQPYPCLFSARELAAQEAKGEYLACVDSHMLIGHNMFYDLVSFMDSKSTDPTLGFAHAPINWAHQHENRSRHDRDMSIHELGDWNNAYNHPRTITWKGMPWMCRRKWFLDNDKGLNGYGALAEHKVSWGGGDMHIGIKPWMLGFKNWAVPTSPGIHIGPYPKIDIEENSVYPKIGADKYRVYGKSGNGPHGVGFLISCFVIGGIAMMNRNKSILKDRFGRYVDIDKEWDNAISLGTGERKWLDKRKITNFTNLLKTKPWDD